MTPEDCPHIQLTRLAGPLHEGRKDYQCLQCRTIFTIELKPVEIIVHYGRPPDTATHS